MNKLISLLLFLMCHVTHSFSQDKNNPHLEIQNTINHYFDGYVERDIDKLNLAFDVQNGIMKVPSKDGLSINNTFFKDILPKWGSRSKMSPEELANCALEILSIDMIDRKIAISKIKMKIGETTYVDVLSLHNMSGTWKITNKMYIVKD